jgi:hypothetical protein
MSLQKIKTNVKTGVGELKTAEGMKRLLVHLGIGAAIGVIAKLALEAIMWFGLGNALDKAGYSCLVGFKIYPNATQYRTWDNTTQQYVLHTGDFIAWDDLALLLITILLLFTRKLWFVIGFFAGWYSSGYFNLYDSLGLPHAVPDLTKPLAGS